MERRLEQSRRSLKEATNPPTIERIGKLIGELDGKRRNRRTSSPLSDEEPTQTTPSTGNKATNIRGGGSFPLVLKVLCRSCLHQAERAFWFPPKEKPPAQADRLGD